jgi:hypothetical protein
MPARCSLAIALLLSPCTPVAAQAVPAPDQAPLAVFRNLAGSFQLGLPAGWRQLAPNEARQIGELPQAPPVLTLAQPRDFYAVGPVDRWRAGDFAGPWLYVVELGAEWHLDDDYATVLAASWRERELASGERHELGAIERARVGTQQVEAIVCRRTCIPPGGKPATACLDIHAPSGTRQITLSFQCAPEEFARNEPEFRRWLATLTFARRPREGKQSLGDRLWTPVLTGAAIGLVLWLLWRHNRARR